MFVLSIWLGSHEIDGEPNYTNNADDDGEGTSGEVAEDMVGVESVCKELGFVLSANSRSRCVALYCCVFAFLYFV